MIKAVLFDMDGVIADTEPLHFKAAQQVLRKTGKDIPDSKLSEYIGLSEAAIHKKVKETYGTRHDFQAFERMRRDEFYDLVKCGLVPTKGLLNFLDALKQEDMRIGLVTSSGREVVDRILDGLKIGHYFNTIVSADDVQFKKPNAEPYMLALKRLGIKNNEAIAIEDSSHGIEAAKDAKLIVIGIRTSYNSNGLDKADMAIDSFEGFDYRRIVKKLKVRV